MIVVEITISNTTVLYALSGEKRVVLWNYEFSTYNVDILRKDEELQTSIVVNRRSSVWFLWLTIIKVHIVSFCNQTRNLILHIGLAAGWSQFEKPFS